MTDPVVMPPVLPLAWRDRWPGRLESELGRFAELGLPADHDAARDQLVVRTRVELHDGTTTPVIVGYPDAYPDRRFEVYGDLRLARRESFGGNLCVFPRSSRTGTLRRLPRTSSRRRRRSWCDWSWREDGPELCLVPGLMDTIKPRRIKDGGTT